MRHGMSDHRLDGGPKFSASFQRSTQKHLAGYVAICEFRRNVNGHRYSDFIRGDQCMFDRIPVSDFVARKDLRIEFAAGESQDAIEETHGDRPT